MGNEAFSRLAFVVINYGRYGDDGEMVEGVKQLIFINFGFLCKYWKIFF